MSKDDVHAAASLSASFSDYIVAADAARVERRFTRELLGWILAAVVLMAIVGIVAYRSVNRLLIEQAWVTHTHQVIEKVDQTLSAVQALESASRGYTVTGDMQYLSSVDADVARARESLDHVTYLTNNQPTQRENVAHLRAAVEDKIEFQLSGIAMVTREGTETAQRSMASGAGKKKMDEVKRAAAKMTRLERTLLAQRSEAARVSARYALFTTTGGVGAAAIIVLMVFGLVRREGVRRARMEATLLQLNGRYADSMRELERLNHEQKLIASLSDHLQTCHDFSEAAIVITRLLPQLFPHTSGAIGRINASRNIVEISLRWGPAATTEDTFNPNACWALRRGRQHVTEDAAQQVSCGHTAPQAGAVCLCQPMMAQGEAQGVLCLQGTAAELDVRSRDLAQSVAESVSMAIANLQLQESLRTQSIRDPLTGLFNRRYMESSLEREIARAKRHRHPLSVLMCDLDHFKRFNDTYGHEAGDMLLAEFGKLLKGNVRSEDIVCRYGGEEFLLILPEADADIAMRRAELIRASVPDIRLVYQHQALGPVTTSIGLATRTADATEEIELVRAADSALYKAKQAGRDRVVMHEIQPFSQIKLAPAAQR